MRRRRRGILTRVAAAPAAVKMAVIVLFLLAGAIGGS